MFRHQPGTGFIRAGEKRFRHGPGVLGASIQDRVKMSAQSSIVSAATVMFAGAASIPAQSSLQADATVVVL